MSRGRRLGCNNDPDPGGGVRAGGLVRHLPGGYAAQVIQLSEGIL